MAWKAERLGGGVRPSLKDRAAAGMSSPRTDHVWRGEGMRRQVRVFQGRVAAGTSCKQRGTGLEDKIQPLVTGVPVPVAPLLGWPLHPFRTT